MKKIVLLLVGAVSSSLEEVLPAPAPPWPKRL